MPVTITVRNVSDDTHAELTARAAAAGQSLQEYLRAQLNEMVEKPDMKTLMGRIRERKARYNTDVSVETILSDLDAERQR